MRNTARCLIQILPYVSHLLSFTVIYCQCLAMSFNAHVSTVFKMSKIKQIDENQIHVFSTRENFQNPGPPTYSRNETINTIILRQNRSYLFTNKIARFTSVSNDETGRTAQQNTETRLRVHKSSSHLSFTNRVPDGVPIHSGRARPPQLTRRRNRLRRRPLRRPTFRSRRANLRTVPKPEPRR